MRFYLLGGKGCGPKFKTEILISKFQQNLLNSYQQAIKTKMAEWQNGIYALLQYIRQRIVFSTV